MIKQEKNKTLNSQIDKKRHSLVRKTLKHISISNENLAWLSKPQQKVPVICLSSPDTKLNSASASMIVTRNSQDTRARLILFCIIYINYDHKPLAEIKKLAIFWDKFKGLALRKDPKFA